jgi:hypothetical protein
MTALQVLKQLKKERWPELKTGEYNLPLIIAAMHKFAELRQCNVSGSLPLSDVEQQKCMKALYPADNSKKFRRQ